MLRRVAPLGVTGGVSPAHDRLVDGAFSCVGEPESERHMGRKIYERALVPTLMAVFTIAGLLVIDLLTTPTRWPL
jgi:hypothetical protein